eukprot:gnl/Chilomastix_caulleri/1512.p1 GENE.gnl/Chilomastix_caulleri/1512~~gnl/Chilomastix_caulleri/1512.p1  ORF type:complete len:191 (+),score=55.65 gnl/Chilomastix_caulleri/1512:211-783(+)
MGRILDVNMADLAKDEQYAYRKLKLRIEQIKDRDCLTNFYGLDMTRDRLCQLFRKGMTFIESFVDVKTLDGYYLRVFWNCIYFKGSTLFKSNAHAAQSSIAKALGLRMSATIRAKTTDCSMKDLLTRFNEGTIETEITKQLQQLHPIRDVYIKKVKVLSTPKFEQARFDAMHEVVAPKVVAAEAETADRV